MSMLGQFIQITFTYKNLEILNGGKFFEQRHFMSSPAMVATKEMWFVKGDLVIILILVHMKLLEVECTCA